MNLFIIFVILPIYIFISSKSLIIHGSISVTELVHIWSDEQHKKSDLIIVNEPDENGTNVMHFLHICSSILSNQGMIILFVRNIKSFMRWKKLLEDDVKLIVEDNPLYIALEPSGKYEFLYIKYY